MDKDWIISLVAVLVSLVTIIISYLTNRDNLKHASKSMVSAHKLEFNVEVWKDILDLSEKLINVTNRDHYELLVNSTLAGKKSEISDDVVLNKINDNCGEIDTIVFNLCAKIKILDRENKVLRDHIREYARLVISAYKNLQTFYLDRYAKKEDYDEIVALADKFATRGVDFAHYLQNYIAELQNSLFETIEDKRKNEGEK